MKSTRVVGGVFALPFPYALHPRTDDGGTYQPGITHVGRGIYNILLFLFYLHQLVDLELATWNARSQCQ